MEAGFKDVAPEGDIILRPEMVESMAAMAPGAGKALAAMVHHMDAANRFEIPYWRLRKETGMARESLRAALLHLAGFTLVRITQMGAGGRTPVVRGMVNPHFAQRVGTPLAGVAWAELEKA